MVSQSFLLAGSSPPDIDGPYSAAIWANCWVGDDSSNLPTSSNLSVSTFLLSILPGVGGASSSGAGMAWTSAHIFIFRAFLPSLIQAVFFILAMLELKENQPIRSQSSFARVTWYLFWTGYHAFPKISIWFQLFLFTMLFFYNVWRVK